MMSDTCREYRAALGAAALGGNDPAEEVALQAHLDGCPTCRAELRDLRSVADALPLADPARLAIRPEPARELGTRVLDRLARERDLKRARKRNRALVATAAAIAVVVAIAAFAVFRPNTSDGMHVVFPSSAGVSADATLRSRPAGTEVVFHVDGLRTGEYYWLWLSEESGERVAAGTFRGTDDATEFVSTAALPLGKTRRIWVTDADRNVVLDQVVAQTD